MACEGFLIGNPFSHYLGIDSRILLQVNRSTLDGTGCVSIRNPSTTEKLGDVGRLFFAQLQGLGGSAGVTDAHSSDFSDITVMRKTSSDPSR